MKRVLAIDGGGIRGVIPARLLVEIERLAGGRPLAGLFDLIAGTSTGGILACGLASGCTTAAHLLGLYADHGGDIFRRSPWRLLAMLASASGPKYGSGPLERALVDILGDRLLSETSTHILIAAYAIELPASARGLAVSGSTRAPWFFKSWEAAKDARRNFRMTDVCLATSAAPTYFPPAKIANLAGESAAFIDGGVFANNPAACALAEARKLWPGERIVMVSLGTGQLERPIPWRAAKDWGLVEWAAGPIFSVMMDGSCDTATYACRHLLGDDFHRLDISLGPRKGPDSANDDMDDASPENIRSLVGLAEKLIAAEGGVPFARAVAACGA